MKKIFFSWMVFIVWIGCLSAAFAAEGYYDRLLNQEAFRKLDHAAVVRMQQNLFVIYQNDRNWGRDAALSQHPLTDGRMGPVTLFWLQRFIADFKIEPIGNRYIREINTRLEQIAAFADMFPEETNVLTSPDFSIWNDEQADLQRNYYYTVRRSGSDQELLDLVDLYRRVVDPLLPAALRTSRRELTTYYYQLTAEDFKVLQGKEQIQAQLAKLVDKKFDNVSALQEAVTGALKDYPDLAKKLLPVIQRYYRYADPVITQSFLEILMGDPLFTALNGVFVTLLDKTLSGVAYPTQQLFAKAVQAKIHAGIGACQAVNNQNTYVVSLKISDEDFYQLAQDLQTGPYQGMRDFQQQFHAIDSLRARSKAACEAQDLELVDEFVAGLYESVIQPAIVLLYKKQPMYSAATPIQWNGEGCGCVLDYLSGTVYGFYPFWLANGEKQNVNFSVLSRVAYHELSFDEKGVIKQTNTGGNDVAVLSPDSSSRQLQNEFVQVARKHNSQVDWVIHNDKAYWEAWKVQGYESRAAVLETLAENIVRLLTRPITTTLSTIQQDLTLGALPPPTYGDGVTLYFEDYPEDSESIQLFNHFFENLQKKLNAKHGEYFANILAPQSAMGTGIYSYTNLLERINHQEFSDSVYAMVDNNANSALITRILVLIEEPTSDAKKQLRLEVENSQLHGIERGLLLRNIIPVIAFDGKNWKQLEDDIVYFKDNFGGVGFWPLLVNEKAVTEDMSSRCDEIMSVTGCLVRFFQEATWHGYPDAMIDQYVCENRTVFRLAMGLLIFLSLILMCLYLYSCRIHSKIKSLYILGLLVIVIPALVIALLLLTYDPVIEPISSGNLPLIIVVLGGIAIGIIVYQRRKQHMKKPSRPRIQAP